MLGGRVVVGVAEIPGVDEPVETRHAVDRERAVARRERHAYERVGEHKAAVGLLSGGYRVIERRGLPGLPAKARDVGDADQHSAGRRLVEVDPDLGVRPESEPGEQVVLYLFDLQVVRALRAQADRDVDAGVVLLDVYAGEVGTFAHLVLPAELGQDATHFGRGQHEIGPEPEPLVEDLSALDASLSTDDHLDDSRTGPGERVHGDMAGLRQRRSELLEGALCDPLGDPCRLGVAVEHGGADLVVRAGADRVVGRIPHDLAPCDLERRLGVVPRRQEQSRSRDRSARAAACLTSTRFDATPIKMLARVPERSSPCQFGKPESGAPASASGSDEITISKRSWIAFASATTRPSHRWGSW